MKFVFTEPKKEYVAIEFAKNDCTKYVEHKNGKSTLLLGMGSDTEMDSRVFLLAIRKAIRSAREQRIERIAFDLSNFPFSFVSKIKEELGRIIAENCILANYEFIKYKTKKESYRGVKEVFIKHATREHKEGIARGQIVADATNVARDLANTPGGDMTPLSLAHSAKKLAKGTSIKTTILSKKELEKLKMGLILGVDKGSIEPCKFIIMEYWGTSKSTKPIVLAGKGITFDTGGINLKPPEAALGMNHDMAGGASVIATIVACAKLKLKKNVVVLVPAVENAVSGEAYRPSDVLTAMDGTTVEVIDTDAEGRLVLGDALVYAEKYKPALVLDVATLTGAALVAFGKRASAVMTTDADLEVTLRKLGEVSGEYVWPLPLWDEYDADLKSDIADIANLAGQGSSARYGGCIHGGVFLKRFTKNYTWAHIDMAPRMESIPDDNLAKGATGAPVRLLVRVVEEM